MRAPEVSIRLCRWAPLLLLVAATLSHAADPTAVRREFMQAWAAAGSAPAVEDSAALRGYLLYPYVQALRLQRALPAPARDAPALDTSIATFLEAQRSAPPARDLRRAWLLDLAARQQWPSFTQHYRAEGADAELRCAAVAAAIATKQDKQAAALVLPLWASGARQPATCNEPFRWAQAQKIIDAAQIEQRARLALKAGGAALARELAALLPPPQAAPLARWAALIEQPQRALDALLDDPEAPVEDAALLDGWTRLARADADAALLRWPRLLKTRALDETRTGPYAMALALVLSWSRRAESGEYFDKVPQAEMTDLAREWQVRAALWANDWERARRALAAMPEPLRQQARWRYWAARIAELANETGTAHAGYRQLVDNEDNFYAGLAAARLGVAYTPHPRALGADPALARRLAEMAGLQRAHELVAIGLRPHAVAEWNALFDTFGAEERLAAVSLAHRWQWYEQAVASAAKLGLFNDYAVLYPRPYEAEVATAARASGLEPELIYAVLRQESLYRPDARSAAGALGLLQLMPETARLTARRLKQPAPTPESLFDPATNLLLGSANLKAVIDRFGGQPMPGIAAYNAGPNAARRWLPPETALDSDIWVENIPYNETRAYVQRVLWHSLVFRWLGSGEAQETRRWLEKIRS